MLEPFHAFKAVFLRAIGLPLLAWIVLEACAGRLERPRALAWAVAAWVAASGLATLLSISPRLSFLGELSQREGLLTTLSLAGLCAATAHAHRDARQVRATLATVLLCAVGAAAYAQLQLSGLDPVSWQGEHTYAAHGSVVLRPAGPLGNATLLGAVLAAGLSIALVWLASARGDAARLVPAAVLIAATTLLTLSRGAWLAAAAGGAVGLVLALRAGAAWQRTIWTALASVAPALAFGAWRAAAPIAARLAEGRAGRSLAAREIIARGALQLWSARPWLGVGPDAFGLAYPRVQEPALWRDEWIGTPVHAHAVPLQILATLGVIGALAGIAWLVAAAWEWRAAWLDVPVSRPTLAAIAGSGVALVAAGATNVVGLAGATLFAVLTALPAALHPRDGGREPARRPPTMKPMSLPAVAAAILCVIEAVSGARELTALALARPARAAVRREGTTPSEWRALTSAHAAAAWRGARLWSGEDTLWRLACDASLAESEAAGGGAGVTAALAAERAARRAVALEPASAANLGRLADALAANALRSGSAALADSADATYERAATAAPADGWLLVSQVRYELARRNGVRAYEVAQKLVGLYPEAAVGHTLSGAALLLLGRDAEARAALLEARSARWEEDAGEQRAAMERLLQGLETGSGPESTQSRPRR